MNFAVQIELSNTVGDCSGRLAAILHEHYNLSPAGLDNAILENVGLILAYMYIGDGISMDEAGSTIACFVGLNCGVDEEKFRFIANAMQFYYARLYKLQKQPGDITECAAIIYNLLHPGKWDDDLHLLETNILLVVPLWIEVRDFLKKEMPELVNPVLRKIDKQ